MKFDIATVLAVSTLMGMGAARAHEFTICAGITDQLGVTEINLNNDTPAGGEQLQVTIGGTAGVTLQGGEIDLKVKVLGLSVGSATFNLCSDVSGVSCPINANEKYEGVITYTLPSATPSSIKASVEANIKDEQGKTVSCIDMKVTTGSKKSTGVFGATDEVSFRASIIRNI